MKKTISKMLTFFLLTNFILSVGIFDNKKNESLAIINSDVIWLDKDYDYINQSSDGLLKVRKNNKCGYINHDGIEAIGTELCDCELSKKKFEEKYGDYFEEECGDFKDGYVNMAKSTGWGILDSEGKEIIPFEYEYIGNFSNGLAMAVKNNKCGFIDINNKVIIPFKFKWASDFKDGVARVINEKNYSFINIKGEDILTDYYALSNFSEGLALAKNKNNNDLKYINKKGVKKIELNRDIKDGWEFSDGLAQIRSYDEKSGYINKSGEIVISAKYAFTYDAIGGVEMLLDNFGSYQYLENYRLYGENSFKDGIANVLTDDMYHLAIDKKGNKVINKEELKGAEYSEGLFLGNLKDKESPYVYNLIGFYNNKGEKVISLPDNYHGRIFNEGIAVISKNTDNNKTKYGLLKHPYKNRELNFDYNPRNKYLVEGSNSFLDITSEENNIDLEFKVEKPDVIKITGNGNVLALNPGKTIVEIIGSKDGFKTKEKTIEVEVKPKLKIDYSKVQDDNLNNNINIIKDILNNAEEYHLNDNDTLNNIVRFCDFVIEYISTRNIKSRNNMVSVNDKLINQDINKTKKTIDEITKLFKAKNIEFPRDLDKKINLNVDGINTSKPILLNIDKDILTNKKDLDNININLGETEISLPILSMGKNFELYDEISIEIKKIKKGNDDIYVINFIDSKADLINKLERNITFYIPASDNNPELSVVYMNDGQNIEQLGGQYDSIKNKMEFETKSTAEYYIVEEEKNFKDIDHLPEDVQEAIRFMASKGFIREKEEGIFDPDSDITRAEFSAFAVKTLYLLDRDLKTKFEDVPKDSWYYDYVASSEKENIVKVYEDNTFKGDKVIDREEIISIASRVLHEQKDYIYPDNLDEYLPFTDSNNISEWAKKEIALAFRETLIDLPDGRVLGPQDPMTRADATLLMYKLFQLLYETTISELPSENLSEKDTPIVPIVAGGSIGIGALVAWFVRKKKLL